MTDDIGKILAGWWREALRPADDNSAARALRARLRRAEALDVLAQPQVHDLVAAAPWLRARPEALIRAVQVLALVQHNEPRSLARVLGAGDPPAISRARFERLVRSEADGLARALRRALSLTDGGCNVASLGRDVLNWDRDRGDDIRRDWYFDYFNAGRSTLSDAAEDVSR